ncbi:response regulator transcription factor [Eggerthella sp. YY7918]|uniref:response regulator transcription factor n=1 Tax=Eggerthella sp. (strain YY7918) TaxID=502558 RepID=UPI00021718F6|nr:response regulator transcription factor [Eggerthella sp. YY7918]BAK45703.1 hypothetical protein EGYY_27060 [Eggerthella sp. YY7918]
MHVLIVEDDPMISHIIEDRLIEAGYETSVAPDADTAYRLVEKYPFDLILLDILLPKSNGFDVCATLRTSYATPIIFMSCLDDSDSIVQALEMGGDDYLVKPFDVEVLLARIKANLRRAELLSNHRSNQAIYRFNTFSLNCERHSVLKDDEETPLTALEFQILFFLLSHSRTYYTPEQIYEKVWGKDSYGDVRTVIVHIHGIRQKIERDPKNPTYLSRQRGRGYAFIPDEDDAQ